MHPVMRWLLVEIWKAVVFIQDSENWLNECLTSRAFWLFEATLVIVFVGQFPAYDSFLEHDDNSLREQRITC